MNPMCFSFRIVFFFSCFMAQPTILQSCRTIFQRDGREKGKSGYTRQRTNSPPSHACCTHSRSFYYYNPNKMDAPALRVTQCHRPTRPTQESFQIKCLSTRALLLTMNGVRPNIWLVHLTKKLNGSNITLSRTRVDAGMWKMFSVAKYFEIKQTYTCVLAVV